MKITFFCPRRTTWGLVVALHAIIALPISLAQEPVIGKTAFAKAARPELKAGEKSVGAIPYGVFLRIERETPTHVQLTFKDQAGVKQGWIRREEVIVSSLSAADFEELKRAGELSRQGRAAFAQSRWEESLKHHQSAADICVRLLGEHPHTATMLINVADLLFNLGRYTEAEPMHRRAIAILEKTIAAEHPRMGQAFNSLGLDYVALGRYSEAEPLYLRAVELRSKFDGEGPLTAQTLQNLSTLYRETKRYTEAEKHQLRSMAIREAKLGKEHPLTAASYSTLGILYILMERYADAETLLLRSLEIRERKLGPHHSETAYPVHFLAKLYYAQEKFSASERLLQRTIDNLQRNLGKEHPRVRQAQTELATVYAAMHRREAVEFFDRSRLATRTYTSRVLPALTNEQQLSYLQTHYNDDLMKALSFARRDGANDSSVAAMGATWLANGKGVQAEAFAAAAQLASIPDGPGRPIAEQLKKVREEISRAKLEAAPAGREREQEEKIAALENRDRDLTDQLQRMGVRAGTGRDWTSTNDIQLALRKNEILIDIARLNRYDFNRQRFQESRYIAWIVPYQGPVHIVDLGEAEDIDRLVKDLRQEMTTSAATVTEKGEADAEKAYLHTGKALAAKILQPLLAIDHVRDSASWTISPDGNLWLVPWAALPDPESKEVAKYLVERHSVRYVSAGRDVVLHRKQTTSPATNPPIIVADPDFDLRRDKAVTLVRQLVQGQASTAQTRSVVSQGLRLGSVQRLPATAIESAFIAPRMEEWLKRKPQTYSGEKALETVVKSTQRPQMLVLSTHGFFLSKQETSLDRDPLGLSTNTAVFTKDGVRLEEPLLRCGLLFAACNDQPLLGQSRPGDDGVLTGLEVVGLDLRGCELVVLSACETGLGDIHNGEGVAGLRQAFQLAGAESVLATLWQVPDRETAQLMVNFFDRLATGQERSTALAESQRKLIARRRDRLGAAHPFFWAAMSLTGQNAPPTIAN